MIQQDEMMAAGTALESDATTTTAATATCVVCNAAVTKVFWSDANRTIRSCISCGLLFVFPQPHREKLHDEFQSNYFTGGREPGKTRLELEFESWRRPMLTRITAEIRAVKPSGMLLDLGCASGEMFEYFRGAGWKLCGIEPSAIAFARAYQRFGNDSRIELFNGYLSDANLEDKSFDVITLLESLYYMPDPRYELSHLTRILKDDGLLAIAVPGLTYQKLRHTGLISYLLHGSKCSLTSSHLFYFSDTNMAKLLQSQGLRLFDIVQLGSSAYGTPVGRLARSTYLTFTRALGTLTLGRINLAPHVLYLCRKSDGNSK